MTHPRREIWSTAKSLAFLAAIFAIVFGALTPAMAAASPVGGQAIMLCADMRDTGPGHVPGDDDVKSLQCAMALIGGLTAPTPPPAQAPFIPSRAGQGHLTPVSAVGVAPPARAPPRPHSTAPPHA